MLAIFDCDGVLPDSEAIFAAVDAAALARLGHRMAPAEICRRFSGVPHRDMWAELAAEFDLTLPDGHLQAISEECQRRFEIELAPVAGADEALRSVRRAGLEVCVASSTPLDSLRRNLDWTGLLALVDPHVFSVSQVRRGKPAPDVFLYAASQTGVDPADCVVIEDSAAGVAAARRAGMRAIGFTGASHADADLGARLSEAGAFAVCTDMAAVVAQVSDRFSV